MGGDNTSITGTEMATAVVSLCPWLYAYSVAISNTGGMESTSVCASQMPVPRTTGDVELNQRTWCLSSTCVLRFCSTFCPLVKSAVKHSRANRHDPSVHMVQPQASIYPNPSRVTQRRISVEV